MMQFDITVERIEWVKHTTKGNSVWNVYTDKGYVYQTKPNASIGGELTGKETGKYLVTVNASNKIYIMDKV